MAKREFIGDPIDATMSYIQDRNKTGETIDGGTTDDDKGDETTDAIPSFVDREVHTDEQLEILQNKVLHPEMSLKELTEKFDYPYSNTSGFLSSFRRKNREKLEDSGMYETFLFPDSPEARQQSGIQTQTTPKHTEGDEKKLVRNYFRNKPNAKVKTAIEETGVSLDPSIVGGLKGSVISKGKQEETDELFVSTSLRNKVEHRIENISGASESLDFDEQMEVLLNEFDRLAGKKSEDSRLSLTSIDEDTLFKIITGGELSEGQRKEIFELVAESGGENTNG